MGYGNMVGWGGGWGGGHMFGFGLFAWVVVIVGIVLLVRWLSGGGRSSGRRDEDDAMAILRDRYARGEIDKAEFDARKQDLG